jgi:hypothetical protein
VGDDGTFAGGWNIASTIRTGPGEYTIALDTAPSGGLAAVIPAVTSSGIAMQDGPFTGANVNVITKTLGDVLADNGFAFIIISLA